MEGNCHLRNHWTCFTDAFLLAGNDHACPAHMRETGESILMVHWPHATFVLARARC